MNYEVGSAAGRPPPVPSPAFATPRVDNRVPFTVLASPFKHARRSAARCASSFPLPRAVDQRVRLNHSARRAEVRKRRRSTSPLAATIQTHNLTNLPLLYDAARAGLILVEGEHDQMLKVRACLERARLPAERACLLPCI